MEELHSLDRVKLMGLEPDVRSRVSTIGERIRRRRQELHMALAGLAEEVGLSASFLSQVERGLVNPSIESLNAIAEALGIPLFILFVDSDTETIVTRHDERRKLTIPDSNFEYELIWFDTSKRMEVLIGRLKPYSSSSDLPKAHTTRDVLTIEECVLVLHGTLELEVGEARYLLEEGDSAYFDGKLPHRFSAASDEELVVLFSISPPLLAR